MDWNLFRFVSRRFSLDEVMTKSAVSDTTTSAKGVKYTLRKEVSGGVEITRHRAPRAKLSHGGEGGGERGQVRATHL